MNDIKYTQPEMLSEFGALPALQRIGSRFPCLVGDNFAKVLDELPQLQLCSWNAYYATTDTEVSISSPKYEVFSLLSSVGGLLGLFSGFSLLTGFQILELFVDIAGFCITKCVLKVYWDNSPQPT